jgi:hypothetical protein
MIHAGHVVRHWIGSDDLDRAEQKSGGHASKSGVESGAA